jgi:LGFP repeat
MTRYGGPRSGQPETDELGIEGSQIGRWKRFRNPALNTASYLVWNPGGIERACHANQDNVCAVYGRIGEVWYSQIGAQVGQIGTPLDEEHDDGTGHRVQHFQTQYITWNRETRTTCVYWNDGTISWHDGPC